jgi:hypothetical protein
VGNAIILRRFLYEEITWLQKSDYVKHKPYTYLKKIGSSQESPASIKQYTVSLQQDGEGRSVSGDLTKQR